jgi:hypothetical protein
MLCCGGLKGNTGNLQMILYALAVPSEATRRRSQTARDDFAYGSSRRASCARERIPSFAKIRDR